MPDILLAQNQAISAGQLINLQCDANGYLYVDVAAGAIIADPVTSSSATSPSQTTLGTTAAQALTANANRKGFSIQNQGTTVIKVLLGSATPTQSNYTIALPACGSTNDGTSPPYTGPLNVLWTGAVQWISDASGGLVSAVELT